MQSGENPRTVEPLERSDLAKVVHAWAFLRADVRAGIVRLATDRANRVKPPEASEEARP